MKIKLLVFVCLFASVYAKAQKVIQLYNGAAPGSESWDWQENDTTLAKMGIVYNVSHPSLTVFLLMPQTLPVLQLLYAQVAGFIFYL